MRQVSHAEMKRQIEREGKRWKLHPIKSVFGEILVAEDIPCVVPLNRDIMLIERVRRDITSISMAYPWGCLLRARRHASQRSVSLKMEIQAAAYQKEVQRRKQHVMEELERDFRKANKQKVMVDYGSGSSKNNRIRSPR